MGPTASGKSEAGFALAERRSAPLLSVDSMQVYRGMDIGTAKPTIEERDRVRHYMIDLVEPEAEYSVAWFQRTARQHIAEHEEVFIVGGSGLHFRSIVDPLDFPPTDPSLRQMLEEIEDPVAVLVGADPQASEVIDLNNPRRVVRALEIMHLTGQTPTERAHHGRQSGIADYQSLVTFEAVGLDPGTGLAARIEQRIDAMQAQGLWQEVERLQYRLGRTASGAVGYKQLLPAIKGETSPRDAWDQLRRATIGLAKRQRTYFRRDPRITWLPWEDDPGERIEEVARMLGL